MKNAPKLLIITFLIIFIFQMIGLIFLLATPSSAGAVSFEPQVGIGTEIKKGTPQKVDENTIGKYIAAIYKYGIGIVGIIAAVVLMFGGVVWLTAGGNQTRIGEAKSWIGASLSGIVIALTSYMILATVNPDIVNFRPIKVKTVVPKEVVIPESTANCTQIKTESSCKGLAGCIWDGTHCTDLPEATCTGKQMGTCPDPKKPYCVVKGRMGYSKLYHCAASEIGSKCYPKIAITCPYPLVCSNITAGVCEKKDPTSCVGKSFGTVCDSDKACNKSEVCVTCESDVGDYCQATPCCPGFVCETRGMDILNRCYLP